MVRATGICRKLLLVAVLPVFCQPNVAQSQAAPQAAKAAVQVPEFEVASIKPNASGLRMKRFMFTPDGFSGEHPAGLSRFDAYGISQDLISGGPTGSPRLDTMLRRKSRARMSLSGTASTLVSATPCFSHF